MSTRSRGGFRVGLLVAVVLALSGCASSVGGSPTVTGTPLALVTTSAALSDCPAGSLVPVRIVVANGAMVFVQIGTNQPANVTWPRGFHAVLVDGRAELLDGTGRLIGRDGDTLEGLSGGDDGHGSFLVCAVGTTQYH